MITHNFTASQVILLLVVVRRMVPGANGVSWRYGIKFWVPKWLHSLQIKRLHWSHLFQHYCLYLEKKNERAENYCGANNIILFKNFYGILHQYQIFPLSSVVINTHLRNSASLHAVFSSLKKNKKFFIEFLSKDKISLRFFLPGMYQLPI